MEALDTKQIEYENKYNYQIDNNVKIEIVKYKTEDDLLQIDSNRPNRDIIIKLIERRKSRTIYNVINKINNGSKKACITEGSDLKSIGDLSEAEVNFLYQGNMSDYPNKWYHN
jgi:hypothetical protein